MTGTAAMLRKTSLFAGLIASEAESVVATAKERSFAAGETIIKEGDPGAQAFYLVVSGAVEARKGDTSLARFGPGGYFGEMALLLEDTARTADVIATEATTCLAVTRWDLRALITSHPDVGVKIMGELARRLVTTDAALSD